MEIIRAILYTILPACIMVFCISGVFYFQKDRIYRGYPSGWLDIKKHSIPDDVRGFLGTDGKRVEYLYIVRWGPYGQIIFSEYDKTYLTHWQPLPDLPE